MMRRLLRQFFCDHAWRKPLPLVALGSGEPLTRATGICVKCGKVSHKESANERRR